MTALPLPWRIARAGGVVLGGGLATYLGLCVLGLLLYTTVMPPTTGVQMQRRVSAWMQGADYEKHALPRPLDAMADDLKRAVVAAEDSRFYEHTGIDWQAVEHAVAERRDGDKLRGGSTISQQLVKNLFMTTHRSYVRKALEVPLTYLAELILSKERILELYLNVIEWGPGVYGAEAAAQHHYGISAAALTRYQSAALAACIPNPRERTPQAMDWYTRIILQRMRVLAGQPAEPSPSDSAEARSTAAAESLGVTTSPASTDTFSPQPAAPLPPNAAQKDTTASPDTSISPSQNE